MRMRLKLLFGAALLALVFVTAIAVMRPTLALLAAITPIAVLLAARSIAYPVAFAGVPVLVIALLNHNPFPHGLITVAFFGWTALAILLALLGGNARMSFGLLGTGSVLCSLLLAIELLMRLPSSHAPSYGSTKIQLFILQNLVVLVAGLLIAQHRVQFERFVSLSILIAGASAFLLLWRLSQGQAQALFDSRFTISPAENPIQLGRQSAEGLLFASYLLLAGSRAWARAAATIVAPVLAISLLAAGSRGPVLGAIAGMLTLFLVLARNAAARRRLFLAAVAGLIGVVLAMQFVPGQSIQRSLSFLDGSGSGISSNGRVQLWSVAWQLFTSHPVLGVGTGSFFGFDGLNEYPHNLLLEAAAELGFVGLVLMLGFLVSSWRTILKASSRLGHSGRPQMALVAALFVSAVVNAMFSGDIPTNSDLWLAAGLGLGLRLRESPIGAQAAEIDEQPSSPAELPRAHPIGSSI
jgi:O-antigen ligase